MSRINQSSCFPKHSKTPSTWRTLVTACTNFRLPTRIRVDPLPYVGYVIYRIRPSLSFSNASVSQLQQNRHQIRAGAAASNALISQQYSSSQQCIDQPEAVSPCELHYSSILRGEDCGGVSASILLEMLKHGNTNVRGCKAITS